MNPEKLGEEILFLRKGMNLSQKELADGIASQSAISQIESGKVFPSIDTLYFISIKLRVDVTYFLKMLFYDNHEYILGVIDDIERLLKEKDYIEVYDTTKYELKNIRNKDHFENSSYQQFLLWNHYLSSYQIGAMNYQKCITYLKTLLQSHRLISQREFQDLKIKNTIANIYAENGELKKSLEMHENILSYAIPTNEYNAFKIKVLYNQSKTCISMDKVRLALDKVEKALSLSIKHDHMALLGQIFYQKGNCMERLRFPFIEVKECYQSSYSILKMQKRELYLKELIDDKRVFLDLKKFPSS